MERSGIRFLLPFALVFPLCILLSACDPEEIIIPTPPATVTISGHVLVIGLTGIVPLADATVETLDGSYSTVTAEDGTWTLEDVPNGSDPVLRVTKERIILSYPPAYNSFPLTSLKITRYDLQTMDPLLFYVLISAYIDLGFPAENICLIFGAAVGFASMDPLVTVPLAGAKVSVAPSELIIPGWPPVPIQAVYFDETGTPDPALTETSAAGAFMVVVPDATAIPSISLSGIRNGQPLTGSPVQPTYPGGFVPAGLIDPYFVP